MGKQTRASLAAAAEGENAPTDPRIAKPDLPHSIAWGTQVQIYTYETSLRKGDLDFFCCLFWKDFWWVRGTMRPTANLARYAHTHCESDNYVFDV